MGEKLTLKQLEEIEAQQLQPLSRFDSAEHWYLWARKFHQDIHSLTTELHQAWNALAKINRLANHAGMGLREGLTEIAGAALPEDYHDPH